MALQHHSTSLLCLTNELLDHMIGQLFRAHYRNSKCATLTLLVLYRTSTTFRDLIQYHWDRPNQLLLIKWEHFPFEPDEFVSAALKMGQWNLVEYVLGIQTIASAWYKRRLYDMRDTETYYLSSSGLLKLVMSDPSKMVLLSNQRTPIVPDIVNKLLGDISAKRCTLDMLLELNNINERDGTDNIIQVARYIVEKRQLDLFKSLVAIIPRVLSKEPFVAMLKWCDWDTYQWMVTQLMDINVSHHIPPYIGILTPSFIHCLVQYDRLNLIEQIYTNDYPEGARRYIQNNASETAIFKSKCNVLEKLYSLGVKGDPSWMDTAIFYGVIDVVEWLNSHGISWSLADLRCAVQRQQIHIIEWMCMHDPTHIINRLMPDEKQSFSFPNPYPVDYIYKVFHLLGLAFVVNGVMYLPQ